MKIANWTLAAGVAAVVGGSVWCLGDSPASGKKKLLLYSQSFGFRHSCVTRPLTGELSHTEKAFKRFAEKAGYEVYLSQDHNDLGHLGAMKRFDALVFYTSGDPPINRNDLIKYVSEGGALIGAHCASDTYKDWPPYVKLIGGCFQTHGPQDREVILKVEKTDHPATCMLGKEWAVTDEIYQFKEGSFSRDNVDVLTSVDTEKSDLKPQKMEKGKDYPISWYNTEGKGRVFYTALGHREDIWDNPKFQQHLLGGIAWALGQKENCTATASR
jgi:type 1 glutamine amidotransferase